ncbi:S-layer homology domain-containing protein [Paenibacillus sp. YN15]|uniref:S-layer homology domain-containing protein n=1 Tax=Paenibacillus sp. YN15 TaxID=1742774 RepID=UPI000DCB1D20|nr:S-layer homology domain-containing protein [Paenibacillus sp. YN15]RAU93302.1 hypothetical protein DQG13_25905 [Paenibacillus sp. YN15]
MKKIYLLVLALMLAAVYLPASALASDSYGIAVAVNGNRATVTGGSSAHAGKTITLRLADEAKRNILADEVQAGTGGSYSFGPYELADGAYIAYVGGAGAPPEAKAFTVGGSDVPPPAETDAPGGGGGGLPVNSGIINAATGGSLTVNGVQISVPAGAADGSIRITVDQVGDTSTLPAAPQLQLLSGVYEIKKDKSGDFAKPVVITLPFDKSGVDFTKTAVGVYWLNEQTRQWVPLDDLKVDAAQATASGTVSHFAKFAVFAADKAASAPAVAELPDIRGHWAEAAIRQLAEAGVIHGYPDSTFKPDAAITRAEFITLIVQAFHLQGQGGGNFPDTSGHWAGQEIATASALGVIQGYEDGTFRPDALITREQMAAIVIRAAGIGPASGSAGFADSADISAWAQEALAAASAAGLVNGYEDGTMKPQANSTRAEAVTVILRTLQLSE